MYLHSTHCSTQRKPNIYERPLHKCNPFPPDKLEELFRVNLRILEAILEDAAGHLRQTGGVVRVERRWWWSAHGMLQNRIHLLYRSGRNNQLCHGNWLRLDAGVCDRRNDMTTRSQVITVDLDALRICNAKGHQLKRLGLKSLRQTITIVIVVIHNFCYADVYHIK